MRATGAAKAAVDIKPRTDNGCIANAPWVFIRPTRSAGRARQSIAVAGDYDRGVEVAFPGGGDRPDNIHQRLYASSAELTFYRVPPSFALADAERRSSFTSGWVSSVLTFDRLFNRKFYSKRKGRGSREDPDVQPSCGPGPVMWRSFLIARSITGDIDLPKETTCEKAM